jgi:hypothetical protein
MHKRPRVIAVCLVVMLVAATAFAQGTVYVLKFNPTFPTVGTRFGAGLSPAVALSGTWYYDISVGTCDCGWLPNSQSDANGEVIPASVPGNYTAKGVVTLPPPGKYLLAPTITVTGSVGIGPPSGARAFSGFDTPTLYNVADLVQWIVTAGGANIGQYYIGTLQERLRNITVDGVLVGDDDWTSGTGTTLNFSRGIINDYKSPGLSSAPWGSIPVGSTFYSYDQDLRLVSVLPCIGPPPTNFPIVVSLGTFHIDMTKVDATHYTVTGL